MKQRRIRLFVKPFCGWCTKAKDWLDAHEVEYEVIDVFASDKSFEEMIRLSGQSLAPVMDVDGEILADFGPEELAPFFSRLEKKDARAAS